MTVSFERGDPSRPRGHALVYFRESLDPSRIRASYLVVAPIEMDLAKYVPPMFAAQLSALVPSGPTAMPLPPVPEPVESLDWLLRLAAAREDDVIDGGTLDPSSPQQMIMRTSELASEYAALWAEYASRLPEEATAEESPTALPDVDDLLLSILSDSEKISRIARLAGTLRYAVEAGDAVLAQDAERDILRIGRHLAPAYRIDDVLAAARHRSPEGRKLLELYLDRCYKLAAEDYAALERLDREIAEQLKLCDQ